MSFKKGKQRDFDNDDLNVNDVTDKSDFASKQKDEKEVLQAQP
jgi:hypothetical protein